MDLRTLRCFVAVADTGTVTAAAAALGIGQPAVSRQLQQLEREIRVDLFNREDGRLKLTSAGRVLLPVARGALRRVEDVSRVARDLAAGRLDEIRILSSVTTRDDILAPWVATWAPDAPLPSLDVASIDDIYARLLTEADLALAPVPPPAQLRYRVVAYLPLWAYVARTHPWAGRAHVTVAELATEPLLVLDRSYYARRLLDSALDRAGHGAADLSQLRSPVTAQAVAASGRGVCVVTDDPRFDLVPLTIHDASGQALQVRLHAAWEHDHHAVETIERMVDELATFVRARYAPIT